jgi:hypothetical protein
VRLEILDSLSEPAKAGAENEDRIGWNATAAFVIDGATNLGVSVVAPPLSDAAWIAELARVHFETELAPDRSLQDVVRSLCETARDRFLATASPSIERYRHPNAGFQSLRLTAHGFEIAGLADCTLFLQDAAGTVSRHSGMRSGRAAEQNSARQALARTGGLNAQGEGFRDAETMDLLRASRARQNTEGSLWTLGIHPGAAAHIRIETPDLTLPASGLLCTDGFADLVDNYALCAAADLIDRAGREGLGALLQKLRHIERDVDPDGRIFPRFKRSDDASAILVKLSA